MADEKKKRWRERVKEFTSRERATERRRKVREFFERERAREAQRKQAREIAEALPQATFPEAEEALEKRRVEYKKEAKKREQAEYYAAQSAEFEGRLKGLRGKVKIGFFEAFIPLVIGILLIIFLPQFLFLGIAIACFAIYFLFRRTTLRGGSKFIIIFLSWFQFAFMTPQLFVALVIIWIGYFSMPAKYEEGDTTKSMEAWVRVILGFLLPFNLYTALGGQLTIPPSAQQFPILLMALAFFFTLPAVRPRQGREVNIYLGVKGIPYTMAGRYTGAIVFYTLMIFALVTSLNVWSFSSSLGLSFIIFWIIGLFLGLAGGREGRPYTGVIVVLFAVFFFSAQFTGIVGSAIFGPWWPQIQAFGESTFAPLSQVSTQLTTGIGDAWLLITNPAQYYLIQQQREQASASRITIGGTPLSIEITNFELFSSVLDPQDVLIGTIDLENKGEFDAGEVTLNIKAIWSDPKGGPDIEYGSLNKLVCTSPGIDDRNAKTCKWDAPILQREIRAATFTFNKDNAWGDLASCINDKNEEVACGSNTVYKHAGESVDFVADINFDYSVNVSIPLEIINQSLYQSLLQNRQIVLAEAESQYSGGPVKATINTQKQPIRNKEESLIRASVLNEGLGNISEVTSFIVLVHKNLTPGNVISSQFDAGCEADSAFKDGSELDKTLWKDYYYIECNHSTPLKTSEFKRVTFFIEPSIGNQVDRKTYSIIGLVNYKYKNIDSKTLQIVQAPVQQ